MGGFQYIDNDRVRKETFSKRVKTLEKSTRELATLCGVPAVIICLGQDQEIRAWPQNINETLDIIARYRSLSPQTHQRRLADYYVDQNVLEHVQPVSQRLPDIRYEDAVEAARSMDDTLYFVSERIRVLTRQRNSDNDGMDCADRESMATENSSSCAGEEPAAAAAAAADHVRKMKTIRLFGKDLTMHTD